MIEAVADMGHGLLVNLYVDPKATKEPGSVTLLTNDGKALTARLSVLRVGAHVLVLADHSVLLIGGNVEWDSQHRVSKRSTAVERIIHAGGELVVERLPDLPGPGRTAFGLVALPDGRAMVLGGTDSRWVGCSPCIADTYFLDVGTKKWSAGPPLGEARADPTATLLPDGSVLVAGGWTPGHGDGGWGVTSHTTERWDPHGNRFTQGTPMPTGMAMHRAVWAAGHEGEILVLAGGNSAAVLAWDVARDAWQVAAELCEPHQTEKVFPFLFQGKSHLWLMDGKAGWCKEGRDDYSHHFPRSLISLRLGPQPFDPRAGIALNRRDFVFVPGAGDAPSHVLGGRVNGNNQRNIADAYAIWPEGRIEHVSPDNVHYPHVTYDELRANDPDLPPLNQVRQSYDNTSYGGKVDVVTRKLADGRIVVAGGQVQEHKIAVVTADSMTPGAPDTYLPIGDFLPSHHYEILEPGAKTWRNSAPSLGAGGPVAVFDDGRVVKLGKWQGEYLLEISTPDGNSWTRLEGEAPPGVSFSYITRPFIIQNELFLSGQLPEGGSGGGPDIVQWFDAGHNRWETLWQINPGDNWRHHVGRIIARTLPNGKRIVLPVEGL